MKQEEVIKTVCNNDVQYQRNKGVFLITTNNNCKVHILGKILMTHQRYVNVKETVPLPRARQTMKILPIKINLESIKLDNLKNAIQQAEKIKIPDENLTLISTTPSWSSILLYFIIITIIGAGIHRFWWKHKSAQISVPQQEAEEIQLQQQPSTRLHLKGGGVMSL
ncbi:unnamed protein product [Arctia plantaginis]|uniref:Uncharacterized protein n=1 Tax=Arctia plantaginis TaxID=874455 RepID=A0A8S1BCV8_ARCPL|nr:unnamed protein product [Arctia plantaginis]